MTLGRKAHKKVTITARQLPMPAPSSKWTRALKGAVKIGQFSSLRKLMRAARRGKMPDERQAIIDIAMRKAATRQDKYLSSHRRQMNALVSTLGARRAS